jgi:hypothetical protein
LRAIIAISPKGPATIAGLQLTEATNPGPMGLPPMARLSTKLQSRISPAVCRTELSTPPFFGRFRDCRWGLVGSNLRGFDMSNSGEKDRIRASIYRFEGAANENRGGASDRANVLISGGI